MRLVLALAASAIIVGIARIPAQATSCSEQIGTIERRLDSAGAVQIAGLRPGHSLQTSHATKALAEARAGDHGDPETVSTSQGIFDAHQLIGKAVEQDRRGDRRGCEDSMTEAKSKIGALP